MKLIKILMILFSLGNSVPVLAADNNFVRPFTLAQQIKTGELSEVSEQVKSKLKAGGFDIIGTYIPYETANIFIITSNTLKNIAKNTPYGGFGAAFRVSVTQVKQEIQVAHNNPTYIGLAYNMKNDLSEIKQQLSKALGFVQDFGGGDGVKAGDLPTYNYTLGLEGFTGFMELAKLKTYKAALTQVESSLKKAQKMGVSEVYRLDIPGKQQTVIGLGLKADPAQQPFLNDKYVMDVIDYKSLRGSAHLPYEVMIDGGRVLAMHPHFRLAVNFPDLKMFGKHSFGRLMDLPYVYEEYFTKAVGGQWPPADYWK